MTAGTPLPDLELVTFRIGGTSCAIEARHVAQLSQESGPKPQVPGSRFFGFPGPGLPETAILVFALGERWTLPIGVEGPVTLGTFGPDQIRPLPGLVAARSRLRGLRAIVFTAEGVPVLVFDPVRAARDLQLFP